MAHSSMAVGSFIHSFIPHTYQVPGPVFIAGEKHVGQGWEGVDLPDSTLPWGLNQISHRL